MPKIKEKEKIKPEPRAGEIRVVDFFDCGKAYYIIVENQGHNCLVYIINSKILKTRNQEALTSWGTEIIKDDEFLA